MQTDEMTLEVWMEPATADQDGPARVVTFSVDPYLRNFTLGQAGSRYQVRLRTTTGSLNGEPFLYSAPESIRVERTQIVYLRRASGESRLYLDGVEVATLPRDGTFDNWERGYELALGGEIVDPEGARHWHGTYHAVAVYCRAFTEEEVLDHFRAGPDPT
jgi:hypothetical protein